ncbi:response regulator [Undibacterium cyanobacteriorum]|uniref:Response regulator n=1 Tax=Undibacterium cyanobacteriorum TaxID=3073561 RepID=A0ABY9RHL1_9BURK|nr:response regulator [Undibacterium sp. 20NA77.5]WMW80708.1 response regulator [Undibacterium sp. 20NA77.5]
MLKAYILDNQAVARNLLGTVLTNGGHEVIGDGNNSPSNIARMVKLQPQIICVDIGEPDQAGLALLDSLRNHLPKSLVFLVSAKMDAEVIKEAQNRGVVGFIVKPFNAVAVLMSIRNTVLRIASKSRAKQKTTEEVSPSADEAAKPEANPEASSE